ncbi:MAG: hypothetical protein ACLTGG_11570, partial [Subdoligranulum sp.]
RSGGCRTSLAVSALRIMRYYLEQNELNRKRHARGGERRPPLVLFLSDFERLCPQQGNAHAAKEGETYENKEQRHELRQMGLYISGAVLYHLFHLPVLAAGNDHLLFLL